MKTLSQIIDEMAKVDDVLKRIGDDMKSNFRPAGYRYGMDRDDEPNIMPNYRMVMFGIRGIGNWHLPSDVDPSSTEAQDYDWEQLDEKSYKQLVKEFKNWVRGRPWANLAVKIEVQPEEKKWVMFRVTVKNRLFVKPGTIV